MKNHREGRNLESFPPTVSAENGQEPDNEPENSGRRAHLPAGWRELRTGVRGARLYRVTSLDGSEIHWQAEMALNGTVQRRRCASELHARWWLAALHEPRDTPNIFEWEEGSAFRTPPV